MLDSDWGEVQPSAADENAYLESHSWDEYADWHLGLTDGATEHTKAPLRLRLRRLPAPPPHRADRLPVPGRRWRHKDVELAAHDLLQYLDGSRA